MRHNSNHRGDPENCTICKMDAAVDRQRKETKRVMKLAKAIQDSEKGPSYSPEYAPKAAKA